MGDDGIVQASGRAIIRQSACFLGQQARNVLVCIGKPGQVIVPIMGKEFHLRLDGFDLGQVLDGLRCRQESWANTAIYLRDEYFPNDSFLCEECSDAGEAQKIADMYQRIISAIERQIDEQGGW
jgi:hypothetical protein